MEDLSTAFGGLRTSERLTTGPKKAPKYPAGQLQLKVAVIGSGVAGLAAAKYLLAEKFKDTNERRFKVTIFERHSEVAGIWNITAPGDDYQTPMYPGLETNVPRTLMEFSDFPYKERVSLFPTHDKIKEYLENYANDIRKYIRFNQEVTNDNKTLEASQKYYRMVVVATGTFIKFSMPEDVGLEDFERQNPGSVIHSMVYRSPIPFVGKKVFLMGGGPSYWDIAKRIAPIVKGRLIVSSRTPIEKLSSEKQLNVTGVRRFNPKRKSVLLADGTVFKDIDIVLACTGYKYEYEFLPKLNLSKDGRRVCDIWEHMLWIPDKTLAFVGLPKMGATMIIAEAQSAFIARYLAGRLGVISIENMRETLDARLEELNSMFEDANGQENTVAAEGMFHNMRYPDDMNYVNQLHDLSTRADEAGNAGKPAPRFGDRMVWTRENLEKMGTAFNRMGTRDITSLRLNLWALTTRPQKTSDG